MPTNAHADGATNNSSASANWITYRGDAQRTGYRDETLGAIPNLVWRYTSTDDAQPLYSSPLVAGVPGQRRVYFAAGDKVYCLDAETGVTQWITPSLSSTIASPLLLQSTDDGDVLYCITTVGSMLAIDPVSGKTIKSLPLQATVQNAAPVPVKTANGNRLIVGTVAGKLIAVDPQSMKIDPSWNVTLGRFGAAVTSTPALTVDGKYLYVPAQDENIYVVDVSQGKVYYPIQMRYGVVGSPAIAGNNVIVANGSLITCLDRDNGRTRWAVSLDTLTQTSPAVSLNADGSGVVYAGTSSGMFYGLNLQDGRKLWQQKLGDTVTGAPTALKDMVLVTTQRGMLFGLDPQKGNIKWQYRVNTERKISTNSRNVNASTTDRSGYSADDNTDTGGNNTNSNPSNNSTQNTLRNPNRFGQDTTIYPLSTAPTVVGGKIYIGGDNLAIYTFDTQPFDASPPLVQDMKVFVNNSDNDLQDVTNNRSIPGKPPVVLKGQIEDDGSGVDPSSIKVLLNGQALPDAFHTYNPLTGDLEINLTGTESQADTPLTDGRVTVEVLAADYAGNKVSGRENIITLRVDNNQAAPEPTDTKSR
ncbi:MAG: PQQ-binding-like beta-propeller repeat protein, partial [Abditibacteriaceae bacterium]